MFVGHIAVGLLGKRAAPRLSAAFLVFCTAFLDVLWPVFILLGVEHARIVPGITSASPLDLYDYPWSHSLAMAALWSLVIAIPWLVRRRWRESLVVALCVFSHAALDVVSHRPDVPLYPGSDVKIGLGLWGSRPATVAVEGALWIAGLVAYARAFRPTSRWGKWGLWSLAGLLTAAWLSGVYGPPPPNVQMVAWSALPAILVFTFWLYTVERRRLPVTKLSQ
jgi:membrane-bound metal-dependent hydrolase YbcI (DUF457 family)